MYALRYLFDSSRNSGAMLALRDSFDLGVALYDGYLWCDRGEDCCYLAFKHSLHLFWDTGEYDEYGFIMGYCTTRGLTIQGFLELCTHSGI